MKDKLYEDYGFKVDYLTYKENIISFEQNEIKYLIVKTKFTNEKLQKISMIVNYLDNYAIFFRQILPNKSGFIWEYGDEKYVVLKPRIVSERKISLDDILHLSSIKVDLKLENSLEEKIDFL